MNDKPYSDAELAKARELLKPHRTNTGYINADIAELVVCDALRMDASASLRRPSYDALLIIAQSVCGALSRAGIDDCDDPGEAIDVMRERLEKEVAALRTASQEDDGIDDDTSCAPGGPEWQRGFNAGREQGRREIPKPASTARAGVDWRPIETAPKDNKRPLMIAQYHTETGQLIELDWDATFEAESESWEIPEVYYVWSSANGRVEEPTHWAYQDELALIDANKQESGNG